MKNKLFKSLGLTVLLLTLLVSNVFAFSFGTTDGVWKRIDSTGGEEIGARCERYGKVTAESFTPIDTLGIINNVNVGPGGINEKYVRDSNVCQGDPDGDTRFAGNNSFGEWTRNTGTSGRWTGLGTPSASCTTAPSLFISEYVFETDDKIGIEIYNGTGLDVNFNTDKYSLLLFSSDREHVEIKLDQTKSVTAGDVYVVTSQSVTNGQTSHRDQTFSTNGNYRTVVLVKDYEEAENLNYGDENSLPGIYSGDLTDENQVRYGTPSGGQCPSATPNDNGRTNFLKQSGFGFDGQIDSEFEPTVNELFPVGRFCHYNNPIGGAGNDLETVPLTLTINALNCPTGQSIVPSAPNNNLNFDFLVSLDETSNYDDHRTCDYGPYFAGAPGYWNGWSWVEPIPERAAAPGWPGGEGDTRGDTSPNRNSCADMVKITAPQNPQPFTCVINPNPLEYLEQKYFVSIMGFTSTTVGGVCPNVPVGELDFNQVYTAEQSNNCYCMYAAYTKNQITPVTMASIGANWTEKGVLIDWVTVTETNNFGFNIMRAEIVDGERIQINPEIILSDLAPGDPFGSSYEYLDETAVPGTEYFYWLVDVPLDGSEPGVYGPIIPAE